jgi:uncharacterized protein (DUF427 family)
MKAIWKNQILAESNKTIVVENNHYFPLSSLNIKYFVKSEATSICPWKGTARYYTIVVNGEENTDAAWYYPSPKEAAKEIVDHVAFWKGVEIIE